MKLSPIGSIGHIKFMHNVCNIREPFCDINQHDQSTNLGMWGGKIKSCGTMGIPWYSLEKHVNMVQTYGDYPSPYNCIIVYHQKLLNNFTMMLFLYRSSLKCFTLIFILCEELCEEIFQFHIICKRAC